VIHYAWRTPYVGQVKSPATTGFREDVLPDPPSGGNLSSVRTLELEGVVTGLSVLKEFSKPPPYLACLSTPLTLLVGVCCLRLSTVFDLAEPIAPHPAQRIDDDDVIMPDTLDTERPAVTQDLRRCTSSEQRGALSVPHPPPHGQPSHPHADRMPQPVVLRPEGKNSLEIPQGDLYAIVSVAEGGF